MKRRSFLAGVAGGAAALPLVGIGGALEQHQPTADGNPDGTELSPAMLRAISRQWFRDARFGLFVHWGVYSVLGKGEWVMNNDRMTASEYAGLASRFNPVDFDPTAWVRLAKEAGMRYITITSKHHDGFAMWDSVASDFNIVKATPYGQDVLKMLADACDAEGLKLFFYHSHLDWRHSDYFPRGRTGQHAGRPESGDFNAYLDFMNAQIEELATGYGKLGGFWFDGWWDQQLAGLGHHDVPVKATQVDWKLRETYELIRHLQPQALISNNHHVPPFPEEDIQIFERDLPGTNTAGWNTATISPLPLESCDTINRSWGYNKTDDNYKSQKELVGYLVRAAGRNANLLLNVGPTPRGTIQPEFGERLRAMGRWLDQFGESIYETRIGPMPEQSWGVSTQKGWTVYIHVLDREAPEMLELPGTNDLVVDGARLLDGDAEITVTRQSNGNLILHVPAVARNHVDTVVAIDLAG